jgi:hypothetical protein
LLNNSLLTLKLKVDTCRVSQKCGELSLRMANSLPGLARN